MNLVFFKHRNQGTVGAFCDERDCLRVEMPAVFAALLSGEEVRMRPATALEMSFAQTWLALETAKTK